MLSANKIIEIILSPVSNVSNISETEKVEVKIIKIDLGDGKYIDSKTFATLSSDRYNIFALPGTQDFCNFLFCFESVTRKEFLYFHLNISLVNTTLASAAIIKQLSFIDLPDQLHYDMIAYPLRIGWFIISYEKYYPTPPTEKKLFCIVKMNEGGQIISREPITLPYSAKIKDVYRYHRRQGDRQDDRQDDRQSDIHICRLHGNCSCKFNRTNDTSVKNLKTIVNENDDLKVWKIIDNHGDSGKKYEQVETTGRPIYENSKLYLRMAADNSLSEVIFLRRSQDRDQVNEEKLERKVNLPSSCKDLNLLGYCSNGDYFLMCLYSNNIVQRVFDQVRNCKFVLVNFFSLSCRIICERDYEYNNIHTCVALNTSDYDFRFLKKLMEVLDTILPRDLIKLLQTF